MSLPPNIGYDSAQLPALAERSGNRGRTAINFRPTGGGRAVATGDFVQLGSEINGVLRALRSHGVEVTALHSHMLGESPRLFFMHFWDNGDGSVIAQGLRAPLDLTNRGK